MENYKKELLRKIGELYQMYGIKSVTMDDVARQLGVSKKTIYQYFSDKEELVNNVVEFMMHERQVCFSEMFSDKHNAIEELLKVNEFIIKMRQKHNPSMFFDLQKYFPKIHEKFMRHNWEKMYDAVLTNIIKGKNEGLYRKEMNGEIIAKIHLSRIMSIFENNKIFSIEELSSLEFMNEAFNYHLRGMANEKGIKVLEELLNKKNDNE